MIENQKVYHNPKLMYKFGYTDLGDANQRFSEAVAKMRNFANVPLGRDYIVRTKSSRYWRRS